MLKDEYILGTGYPYFEGTFPTVFVNIALSKKPVDKLLQNIDYLPMDRPIELENENCPKYELVLRRVK